jgi:hypothetical protein
MDQMVKKKAAKQAKLAAAQAIPEANDEGEDADVNPADVSMADNKKMD